MNPPRRRLLGVVCASVAVLALAWAVIHDQASDVHPSPRGAGTELSTRVDSSVGDTGCVVAGADLRSDGQGTVSRGAPESTLAPPIAGASEQSGDGFPSDYRGVRDKNMLLLYQRLQTAVAGFAAKLDNKALEGFDLVQAEEGFLRYSAYVSLIQQQRYYSYGYQKDIRPPRNTGDAVYHVTGMADMQLVLELTRAEFPDLFAAMYAVRRERDALMAGSRR